MEALVAPRSPQRIHRPMPLLAALLPPALPPTVAATPDSSLMVWTAEQVWYADGTELQSVARWREPGAAP